MLYYYYVLKTLPFSSNRAFLTVFCQKNDTSTAKTTPNFTPSAKPSIALGVNLVSLPAKTYQGYIFDLDGTLVDSMPIHYKAWRKALAEAGAPHQAFLAPEFYSCGGKSAADVVAHVNRGYDLHMDEQAVSSRKREYYFDILQQEGTAPITQVIDFVKQIKGKHPIAIATGSTLPGALATLKSAGLENLFDIIVTPDDVQNGKPAPDMFLLAAEKMGVPPEQCVVFEDAEPGLLAAKAAGMDSVTVLTPEHYFLEK